jgi:hypothetical protein
MLERCLILLALIAAPLAGVDPASSNLGGTWNLNVERSSWTQGVAKPVRVTLWIEHREPAIRYSGSVVYTNGETRDFAFEGAIDGKAYAMSRSYGDGTITLKRYDGRTVDSVFRTKDGLHEERVRIRVSTDGKALTRDIRYAGPDGARHWVEVYDKGGK